MSEEKPAVLTEPFADVLGDGLDGALREIEEEGGLCEEELAMVAGLSIHADVKSSPDQGGGRVGPPP